MKTKSKDAAPRKRPTLYHDLNEIIDSGLLSAERIAELNAEIDRRIDVPYTKDGRPINSSRVIDLGVNGEKKLMLYPRVETGDYQDKYIRREILNVLLTDEEAFRVHDYCSQLAGARREARLFEAAEKVDEVNWDGWVCYGVGDHYYESIEDFIDMWYSDNGEYNEFTGKIVVAPEIERPVYLWAAEPHTVIPSSIDVVDVVEHWLCDRGWDEMSEDDLNGVKELQSALDTFCKANESVISYQVNTKKAILIDWAKYDG